MTSIEKNESLINRINKLLALAMDSGASEHERKRAQERADELMARHAIDRMDLTVEEKGKVIIEEFTISVLDLAFREHLVDMMSHIVMHANCRAVRQGFGLTPKFQIVGFPEDVKYAQRLWFIAFSEMAAHINPRWDDAISFDTNVHRLVKAGWKWDQINDIAVKHGGEPKSNWLRNAYNRECKRLGESNGKATRHLAYRTSYVEGFVTEVARKLRDMRAKTKETIGDNDRFALAVRSTKEQVDEEFYLLFPHLKPMSQEERNEYMKKWRAQEQAKLAGMTADQRAAYDRARRKEAERARRRYDNMRNSVYDPNGWSAGSAAGKKVDFNDSTKIKTEKKELS